MQKATANTPAAPACNLKPLNKRLLVLPGPPPSGARTESGLFLTDDAKARGEYMQQAVVIAVADDLPREKQHPHGTVIKPGDYILFHCNDGFDLRNEAGALTRFIEFMHVYGVFSSKPPLPVAPQQPPPPSATEEPTAAADATDPTDIGAVGSPPPAE